jgi:quercetin dioxygenase-like cupin family protein
VSVDESLEAIRERAALYALGVLPPDEADLVEQRLAAGDRRYVEEVDACRAVADALPYAARPLPPRPQVRERVLARVADAAASVVETAGIRFVHASRVDWEPGPVPGMEIKRLQADESRQRATLLIRLAPGTTYPRHRHGDVEEIYLLAGEITLNGVVMRAGDYCRAAADSIHEHSVAAVECLFLVTASTRDEVTA